jgi:hypothetical protein
MKQHIKFPCTLLEGIFQNAAQDSSEEDRRFNFSSGMCPRTLQLSTLMDVEFLLSAWHQIC